MKPELSIVTSVYNGATYLPAAIRSVLDQSFGNWEWILIDDGSKDSTASLIAEAARADSRILPYYQENCGLTRTLIRGCDLARAPIIARHDGDDLSDPSRFEKQLSLLNSSPDFAFVSCFSQPIGPQDEPLEVITRPRDSFVATDSLLNAKLGPPAHGSVMFRKSSYHQVGGYRDCFYYAQDSDLWMRLGEIGRICYVPEVLYFFRRHFQSITGAYSPDQELFGEWGQECRRARAEGRSEQPILAKAESKAAELRARRVNFQNISPSNRETYFIASQLFRNRDTRCRTYLLDVLKRQPYHWRALLKLIHSYTFRARS